jgi:MinD-like ATPase involved in chromosome partitioning or flagellar assembly
VRYPQTPSTHGWIEPPTGHRPAFATDPGVLRSPAFSEPDAGVQGPLRRPLSEPAPPHPGPPFPPAPAIPPPPNAEQLAQSLRRTADTYGIVLPARWSRGVRAITLGLLAPGAAAAIEQERWLLARVRTRRREPWTVGFIAGKGGVGTTTTAAAVALTLATLRTDEVTIVDAQRGAGSLGHRLANRPAPTVPQLAAGPPTAPPAPPPGPLRARGGLGVVDGVPWHDSMEPDQLMRALEDIRRSSAFTLVDIGDDLSDVGATVLSRVDQVVLVTTTSQDAVGATAAALGRIGRTDPRRFETIVIAVVCLTARQYRRAARRLRTELGLPDRRIVAVPFDPALATGAPLEPEHLRAPTREAFVRLAGYVADPGPPGPAWVRFG